MNKLLRQPLSQAEERRLVYTLKNADDDVSLRVIARRFGKNYHTIVAIMRKHGITREFPNAKRDTK